MIAGIGLEQIDSILDQLDSIGREERSRSQFYETLLHRLKLLLNAQAAAWLIPLGSKPTGTQPSGPQASGPQPSGSPTWSIAACVGTVSLSEELLSELRSLNRDNAWSQAPSASEIVVGSQKDADRGALYVRLNSAVDSSSARDLVRLIEAFVEIIVQRNQRDDGDFLQNTLPSFHRSLGTLSQSTDIRQAAMIVSNDLQDILNADRVSLVRIRSGEAKLLTASGVIHTALSTETTRHIQEICQRAAIAKQPLVHVDKSTQTSGSPSLYHHIAIPLRGASSAYAHENANDNDLEDDQDVLLLQWHEHERFLIGLSWMQYIVSPLASQWQAQRRLHSQPTVRRWLRWVGLSGVEGARAEGARAEGAGVRPAGRRYSKRWRKIALGLGCCGIALWGLTRPCDFRIEMEGVLEPSSQRTVYAAYDGYVDQLLVDDNSEVLQGQTIAVMRSPQLDLQIQEVRGELRANREREQALSLSLNQVSGDGSEGQAKQQAIASELKLVRIQQQTSQSKLDALEAEFSRLTLTSPIDGVIVSREIARMLDSRPIRRGDAVVRVADPSDGWRLAIRIHDSDVSHVKSYLEQAKSVGEDEIREIEFVIASQPRERFHARLNWLAPSARNPDGQGVVLDALAEVEPAAEQYAHMGATVHAYFVAGKKPFWYVWSRPLWDAVLRKVGF